jgi:leader peptidase (prepilin peptidase) / N-methyltransferase
LYPKGGRTTTVRVERQDGGIMIANWPFALTWAAVGISAGLVLGPTTAHWFSLTDREYRPAVLFETVLTGAVFALIATRFPAMPELLAVSVFVAVGVQLAVIDARTHRLPRTLIWPTLLIVTCLFAVDTAVNGERTVDLVRAIAGSAISFSFYAVVAAVSRGGMGAGDVRMAALTGCVLGCHSWPALISGTFLAFVAAGAITVALKRGAMSVIPFGPAMLLGTVVALFL